jgi:hypothetical protein
MKVKQVFRRGKPFEGCDTLTEWHKEKTKSSASQAYKDADYATPIWRCESDTERALRVVGAWGAVALGVGLAYFISVGVVDWLKNGG